MMDGIKREKINANLGYDKDIKYYIEFSCYDDITERCVYERLLKCGVI